LAESTSSSSTPEAAVHVVILAGGVGSRFWPASTPDVPKQLLPLLSGRPLVADTLDRAKALAPAHQIHVLANQRIGEALRDRVGDLLPDQIWEEPSSAGTGPALAFAAWAIHRDDPTGTMVSLHSDHRIEPLDRFVSTLNEAVAAAESGALLTLGVRPTRPDPGFGYLLPASPPGQAGIGVAEFVEKPTVDRAAALIESGWLWNSGIFVWRVDAFLAELEETAPGIAALLPLLDRGDVGGFFREAPHISVDHAVLEKSTRLGVVRASFEWDDLGSWEAIGRLRAADGEGNVAMGSLHALDSAGNVTYAEGGAVALFGVEDLVVVHTPTVTFVMPRARADQLKTFVGTLPPELRER